MNIELLWFEDCPNHETTEELLAGVLDQYGVNAVINRVEVPDEETGKHFTFPGSPTVRINGVDVEPGWEPCDDCTPRCRLYLTSEGLRGVPERIWIEDAVREALATG